LYISADECFFIFVLQGFLGGAAGALGLIISGATSDVMSTPSVSLPSINLPGKSTGGAKSEAKAPSAVKKVEKKIKKIKDSSGYDLSLEAKVKGAEADAKASAKVCFII
jgi:hypothetical protein